MPISPLEISAVGLPSGGQVERQARALDFLAERQLVPRLAVADVAKQVEIKAVGDQIAARRNRVLACGVT